jgi:hypothetical protein
MHPIPSDILTKFEAVLKKRAVPVSRHADYRKWLRYYLDFAPDEDRVGLEASRH